jgi:hypothetical protein
VRALQQAQDGVQLLKLRVLQQNPVVYKAFALQDLASDLGCRPLVGCRLDLSLERLCCFVSIIA